MIFIVYQHDSYKEYMLPNIDNSDFSILIDRYIFGFSEDINLRFEMADGCRYILSTDKYSLFCSGTDEKKHLLTDGDILTIKTFHGEEFRGIISESTPQLKVIEKYDLANTSYISIGEDADSIICYSFNDLVSNNHCEIRRQDDGFYIYDKSTNGIFLNNRKVGRTYKLAFGDTVSVFGLHLVYLGDTLGVASSYGDLEINGRYLKKKEMDRIPGNRTTVKNDSKKQYFSRSPRIIPPIDSEEVVIESPPSPKFTKRKPLLYTIGPAFTMAIPMLLGSSMAIISSTSSGRYAGAFMYTGIITAVCSAIIGVVWGLLNMRYVRQSEATEEQERFNAYGNYLIEKVEKLKKSYGENAESMHSMYPSASDCCKADGTTYTLWNRNCSHGDFLFCRLGLGDIPFQVNINIPKEKFDVVYDELREKPSIIKKEYEMLRGVPVGIDMYTTKLFGIVGGNNKVGAFDILYDIVSQVAVTNCYTDVKMVFVYDERELLNKGDLDFAKWLPHVWSENKSTRYVASNRTEASDIFYELASVFRRREEEGCGLTPEKNCIKRPHYLIFITDPTLLDGQLIAKYIYDPKPEYGLTTFIMSDAYNNLPNECENIIENDKYFTGIYNAVNYGSEKRAVRFDRVSSSELDSLAKRLSGIQVNEAETTLDVPSRLDFMEMYGVHSLKDLHVEERWRKNRTFNTMRVLIGKKAGGDNCFLDIHEKFHGPHGLVAGTTGSGKSELLQTYILSLAVNYSPEDVAFFVIDYKGGGMANLFSDLPHMIGQISNLSGNQVRRAMISIKSENMRRQRLFNECGVNNINLYTRLYKNHEISTPVPHLFIIIDEFAELKKEQPDFMRELISVAQVGRSLGVHLILSTQKPSGTVDDNIWSNSKFRLCLRVQDRQDSIDMLHKPDAAYITQAGRAYLQVGNDEIYELFQSGWSGAVFDDSESEKKAEIAEMILPTGKTAIVGSRAQIKHKENERREWYISIVKVAVETLKAYGLSDISEIKFTDRVLVESFITSLMKRMNALHLNYKDTNSNRHSLERFLENWPSGEVDPECIVDQIIKDTIRSGSKLPEKRDRTQLEAIVNYLSSVSKRADYNYNLKLWLPILSDVIYLDGIKSFKDVSFNGGIWPETGKKWGLSATVGIYDDPENQAQLPFIVDFGENGNYAVCGMVVSGKSTFIQTLMYSLACKYSPEHISMYLIDFSSHMLSPFEYAPHCGGVIYDQDSEKLSRFFNMLNAEMDRRKALFGGGNYIQYVQVYGKSFPAWVVAIDNYAGFREKTDGAYDDQVLRLVKEGIGYGIYFVVTAGGFSMSEIPGRIADNIRTSVSLELGDKFKYMDVMRTTRLSIMPEIGIKGRGLAYIEGNILEFQTALSVEAEDDFSRAKMLTEQFVEMNNSWDGARAKRIPEIPQNPMWDDLCKTDEYAEKINDSIGLLPFAYSEKDASIYSIDLSKVYCYCISGKSRTGKTNVLKAIMKSAAERGGRIVVFEKGLQELKRIAEQYVAEYLATDREVFDFLADIKDVFVKRNKLKRDYINEGLTDSEIYSKMKQQEPVYIFISNMDTFIESVYRPEAGVGEMKGFVENVMEKGILHNIFIFACINNETVAVTSTYKAYKNFVSYKTGIHLGGNVSTQKIFAFRNIPYSEQSKAMKKGVGLVPSKDDDTMADRVIVPLV